MTTKDRAERRLLALSIAVTLASAAASVGIGLGIGSKAVVFDGIYEVIDAGMTAVALVAVRLIARGEDNRFQFGYWHLEPMLALANGLVLTLACVYAFIDGVSGLLGSGRGTVSFGYGIAYAAASAALSLALYAYVRRRNAVIGSQLLALDARAWLIGGVLGVGLCVSFVVGAAAAGTWAAPYAPYIDSAILIVLAAGLAPFPLRTIWRAGGDILQIAPQDLDARVRAVAAEIAARRGFVGWSCHVMRSGRAQFIEVGLVAPSRDTVTSYRELDEVREEIAGALGGLRPGYWLTVDFTADERWI